MFTGKRNQFRPVMASGGIGMTARRDLHEFDRDEWNRLQDLLDQFEQQAREVFPVDFAAFLPAPGDRLRPVVLEELVRTDLELHWRNRRPILVEEYLVRYPELRDPQGYRPYYWMNIEFVISSAIDRNWRNIKCGFPKSSRHW